MAITVNCTDTYNDKSFAELKDLLERGETVIIHIDCVSPRRAEHEEYYYAAALQRAYGGRLQVTEAAQKQYRLL